MKMVLPLAAAAALVSTAAVADEVRVTIDGVQAGAGQVLVALQSEDEFLQKDASYTAVVPADGTSVEAVISGVEPGEYAIAVVHDEDGDGDFSVGETGPTEGWGLSGDVSGTPEFGNAAIEVESGSTAEAAITLNYPS